MIFHILRQAYAMWSSWMSDKVLRVLKSQILKLEKVTVQENLVENSHNFHINEEFHLLHGNFQHNFLKFS